MTLLSSRVVSLPPRLLRLPVGGRSRFLVGRFALCIGPRGGAGDATWIHRLGYQSGWGCGIANRTEAYDVASSSLHVGCAIIRLLRAGRAFGLPIVVRIPRKEAL